MIGPPKTRPFSVKARALSCQANILAREAPAEDIGFFGFWPVVCVEGLDIVINWRIGPMLVQNLSAEVVLLALPDHLEARPLEAEVKAANPREK